MMGVLIPSVMALRETAMTAPLGQQGEPFTSLFFTNYNTFVRIIQVVIFGCASGGILL